MKSAKRTLLVVGFIFFLTGVMVPQGESRNLILGHGAAPGNPRTLAADMFAKSVAEGSKGQLTIQIQGSEQLGSDVEMLQSAKLGTLDITANSQGPLSNMVPEAAIFGLPFLFSSPQEVWKILDGPIGDKVAALVDKQGMKLLAWWDNGIRHITNNQRPIKEPADLKGLKIRTPQDPITIDIFKALGANPTPIAFGELYLALRQGTVDGQENPLVNIWSAKLHEVQKYVSLSGHKYESTPFIVSMKTWNSLSPEHQQLLQRSAKQAGDFQRKELVRQTDELLIKFKDLKLQINTPNQAPFREATKSVYETWQKKLGDIVVEIQKAAASAGK
jgi:tripartite ATP-independent transporter DctP family solute receptor